MSLFEEIKKAPVNKNIGTKTLVYGDAGIGKTTWSLNIPCKKMLFFNLERGVKLINFDQETKICTPNNISFLEIHDLLNEIRDFRENGVTTIVIDSITKLEQIISNQVCLRKKVDHIEEIGFGKGYVEIKKEFQNILEKIDEITEKGINVVLIGHSKIEVMKNPQGEDYNYFDVSLHKHIKEILIPSMDTIAFLTMNHSVKDGKINNSSTRILKVDSNMSYLSKNRNDIDKPVSISDYKSILGA